MIPEKSAGVVTFHHADGQRKYLLLHYVKGHWGFPRGHLEAGETPEQAAMRELAEETGLTHVFLLSGFNERLTYYFTRSGKPIFAEVTFFMAESPAKAVTISDEHIGFRWLPYTMAVKALTFRNEQDLLSKAEQWITTKKPGGSFSGHAAIGKDA